MTETPATTDVPRAARGGRFRVNQWFAIATVSLGLVTGGADVRRAAVRGDLDRAQRREDVGLVTLVRQHPVQRRQDLLLRMAGERQRPPGGAQAGAERRLVGAVAADVADHQVDRAVFELDGVVEVAPEQRPAAPGAIVGGQVQARVVQ